MCKLNCPHHGPRVTHPTWGLHWLASHLVNTNANAIFYFFLKGKKKSIWMFSALAPQETPLLCSSVWDHSLISVSHSHSPSLSHIGLQKITEKLESVDLLMPKAKGHANPRLFCQMVCARLFLWNACVRVSSACISTGPIALCSNADPPLPDSTDSVVLYAVEELCAPNWSCILASCSLLQLRTLHHLSQKKG